MPRLALPTLVLALWTGCRETPAATTPAGPVGNYEWVTWSRSAGDPDQALPTVVAMHGLGDEPERFIRLFHDHPGPIRVVAPAAPLPWRKGHAWFSARARTAEPAQLSAEIAHAADDLAAWIGTWSKDTPVVVTGFSQGGMMSFALAARHPDQIRGAIPVSGFLPEPNDVENPAQSAPLVALHGLADEVVPADWARNTVDTLKSAGANATLVTWPEPAHQISAPMKERLYAELDRFLAQP